MKIKDKYPLVQLQAAKQYSKGDPAANKLYPSLEIVRLEKIFFKSKKGKLLDYACGGGCNAIHLLKCGYNVYGIDVNLNSLKLLRKISKKNKKLKKPELFLLKKDANRLLPSMIAARLVFSYLQQNEAFRDDIHNDSKALEYIGTKINVFSHNLKKEYESVI